MRIRKQQPKVCHFGLWVILRCRWLENVTCKKGSLPFRFLFKSRQQTSCVKNSLPIPRRGGQFLYRGTAGECQDESVQANSNHTYLPFVSIMFPNNLQLLSVSNSTVPHLHILMLFVEIVYGIPKSSRILLLLLLCGRGLTVITQAGLNF